MLLDSLKSKKLQLESFLGKYQIIDLDTRYYFYGICVAFFLMFPMSMYRFFKGDYIVGMVDLAISLLLLYLSMSIWNHKEIKYLNYIVFITSSVFMLVIVSTEGINNFMWIFPLVAIGYYTINKTVALLSAILMTFVATAIVIDQITLNFLITYYPALTLINLLLYLGACKAEVQRNLLFELATIDCLTRVNNRLAFNKKISDLGSSLGRNNQLVSIMILDIDHFKKINDNFGHAEGDKVLAIFAELLKGSIRSTDSVYRYGGEEFVVLAYNSNLESTAKLAESIRLKVEDYPCLTAYNLTVSIGVTEIPINNTNVSSWLDRADEALYLSKNRGRNKVYLSLADSDNDSNSYIEYEKYIKHELTVKGSDKKIINLDSYQVSEA